MKLLLLLACFVSIWMHSSTIKLECNYNMNSYATTGSVYRCQITKNLIIKSSLDAFIEDVSGNHTSGKNNDDVLAFHASNKEIEYFPKGLDKFFKNIKVFYMPGNKIKEISQLDLKPFKNLVHFEVGYSVIEILEDDLFVNHPNMKVIWLTNNKIFHVGKNVFDNMHKVTYLSFSSNPCISSQIHGDASIAKEIVASLKSKCYDDTTATFLQNLKNLEDESKTLSFDNFQTFNKILEKLEKEFKSSKISNSTTIQRKFQKLTVLKESKMCFAANVEEMLTGVLSGTEKNLKSVMTTTCSANDVKLSNLDDKISNLYRNVLKVDQKVSNADLKCSNFGQLSEKLEKMENKFTIQESAVENLGKELSKLSQNQKEVRNDISKLDENMSTLLETSSTDSDKIDKNFSNLEEKILEIDEKMSKIDQKFSGFEEKFKDKVSNLEKKLDKLLKYINA